MLKVIPYAVELKDQWDSLIKKTNAPFLFFRDYMEYHRHRFVDSSVLIFKDKNLLAVFPSSRNTDSVIVTHGGLTYGGLVLDKHVKTADMLIILDAVLREYKSQNVAELVYKVTPNFYEKRLSQAEEYALFQRGAILISRGLSTGICLGSTEFPKKKIRDFQGKLNAELSFETSENYDEIFFEINQNLQEKHHVRAVHSALEFANLANIFPDNIQTFCLRDGNGFLYSAIILYLINGVAHVQYMLNTELGKKNRSLDKLIYETYQECKRRELRWLEFGISTTDNGKLLNLGLLSYKEGFGGSPLCYDTYTLSL